MMMMMMSSLLTYLHGVYLDHVSYGYPDARLLHEYTHVMPWIALGVYLVGVVYLLPRLLSPLYLRHRHAYETGFVRPILKPVMVAWNYGLCVLSVCMFVGTLVPYVGHYVAVEYQWDYVQTLCDPRGTLFLGKSTSIFWIYMFVLSKYAELVDTVLLIVKNPTRKVEFLHWFHHATVLLFCWYAGYYRYAVGSNFAIMNALIHSFMYYYYGQMERGIRPTWGKVLTVCQILQMVFGIGFNAAFAHQHYFSGLHDATGGCSCSNPDVIMGAAVAMYGSYLFLFVQFFAKKYFGGSGSKGKKAAPTAPRRVAQQGQEQGQEVDADSKKVL